MTRKSDGWKKGIWAAEHIVNSLTLHSMGMEQVCEVISEQCVIKVFQIHDLDRLQTRLLLVTNHARFVLHVAQTSKRYLRTSLWSNDGLIEE